MSIYNSIEQYLPEMVAVRDQYNAYLKENNLAKTAEEKLFDSLAMITDAYTFHQDKMNYEFSSPDVAVILQKDNSACMYKAIPILSERMRYHKMQDKTEFSSPLINEFYQEKENIEICPETVWTYKRFPAREQLMQSNKNDMVRYALNVKPGIGLFEKLDALCLKHDVYSYKIIDKKLYNQRTDPIIIYADKTNQPEMLKDLETLIKPYRRRDEYDMLGYQNLGNGIFTADEIKKDQITQLKYSILTPEERDVFTKPAADEFDQLDREFDVLDNIKNNSNHQPLKNALISWLCDHEYDYSVSNAQYQAGKMIVEAYNKTKPNNLVKNRLQQNAR